MSTAENTEKLPFFLRGNYAPVEAETTATDLDVDGAIPPSLSGRYLRIGPNPRGVTPPHWFFGDGMLHGVALGGGRARWYRNRQVRTRQLAERPRMVGPDGRRDLGAGPANTNVVRHAGRTLALAETTTPWEVTDELETVGPFDFGGRLTTGMTAHPKLCPRSGELHFFDYDWFAPHLTWHVADATGALVRSVPIDVPGPTMVHDFAITDRHVVFFDLPVVFDFERAMRGAMPYRFDESYGARVGLLARDATTQAGIRWFDVAPCYVFHPMNAFEQKGRVVVDVARYPELWREGTAAFDLAFLHRWELDLATGKATETALDDRPIEFPRVDERRTGSANRFGYAVRNMSSRTDDATSLLKYDLVTGSSEEHDFGPGRFPGEFVFVADSARAGEDEGWLMGYVYDAGRGASDLAILDANDFAGRAVATVHLPVRVPFGFHGNWMAD